MGWFNKKTNKGESERKEPFSLPKLPELPKLDEFNESFQKLPALPTNSLRERRGGGVFDENKFEQEEDKIQAIQKPIKKFSDEIPQKEILSIKKVKEISREQENIPKKGENPESIFIRLDKFEESLKIFEKTKTKIEEVERLLKNTKRIKEEEEKELASWEEEINMIKEQLENIDKNIFSKIE